MLGYTREFMDETYRQILDFSELWDFADRPFKQLSTGMQSRLAFSIASLVQPEILILDEVLSVGDGAFQEKSAKKMREIIDGGAATILVSHSLGQVRELCNKVLWLDHGRQVAYGEAEKLCDAYEAFLADSVADVFSFSNWMPPQENLSPQEAAAAENEIMVDGQESNEPIASRPGWEDVVNCYRYILGREPESEKAIEGNLTYYTDREHLRLRFLQSEEFSDLYSTLCADDRNSIESQLARSLLFNSKFLSKLAFRLSQTPCVWGDPLRLNIHPTAIINDALLNTNSGTITIGAYSFTGHGVSILTGSHYMRKKNTQRMGFPSEGRDIVIGTGVWLASKCIVMGPCRIEDHAVVTGGAVVVPGTNIPAGTVWEEIRQGKFGYWTLMMK